MCAMLCSDGEQEAVEAVSNLFFLFFRSSAHFTCLTNFFGFQSDLNVYSPNEALLKNADYF